MTPGLLLLVAVLIPSWAAPWLPGLPLTGPVEIVAALLAGVVLVPRPRPRMRRAILALGVFALVVKAALLAAPPAGFEACYRVLTPPASHACESSYDDAFAGADRTRLDEHIDFGSAEATGLQSSDWDLSAANSLRYNFFRPGDPNRDRLAIGVTWRGRVDTAGPLRVTYVGEGSATAGGVTTQLPPAYDQPATATVTVPEGSRLELRYAWQPPAGRDGARYAEVRVTDAGGHLAGAAGPSWPLQALAWLAALALVAALLAAAAPLAAELLATPASVIVVLVPLAFAGGLAAGLGSSGTDRLPYGAIVLAGAAAVAVAARRRPLLCVGAAAAAVAVGGLVGVGAARGSAGLTQGLPVVVALAVLLSLCAARWRVTARVAMLAAVTGALAAAFALVLGQHAADPADVIYRSAGNDPLANESFARAILDHGDLEAGESLFYYQPGLRYLLFLQHLVFGDSDLLTFAAAFALLLIGLWFAIEHSVVRLPRPGRPSAALLALGALLVAVLAVFVGTPEVFSAGIGNITSEYPTWILLAFAMPLVLFGQTRREAAIASLLLGLSFFFRTNQIAGIAPLLLVLLVRTALRERDAGNERPVLTSLAAVLGPVIAVGLVLPLHNVVYGGKLTVLPTSGGLAGNYPLKPGQLVDYFSDASVRHAFKSQLAGVLVVPSWDPAAATSTAFRLACRALQLAWLALVVVACVKRFRDRWRAVLLVGIPVCYLVPHLFLVVYNYYPRHIVVGYLSAALALLAVYARATAPAR